MRRMRYLRLISILLVAVSCLASGTTGHDFEHCMLTRLAQHAEVSTVVHSNSSLYSYLLQSSQQSPRWVNTPATEALFIVAPFHESQVQSAVLCGRAHGLQIRVRSGGHDYEGLSYLCRIPFIVTDRPISDRWTSTRPTRSPGSSWEPPSGSWTTVLPRRVGSTDSLELYAPASELMGTLHWRRVPYDAPEIRAYLGRRAHLTDVDGRTLDRRSMGEDLFWAIRGAGGGSFGIVVAWRSSSSGFHQP